MDPLARVAETMRWIRDVYDILEHEDESWLCYQHGQLINYQSHLRSAIPRMRGTALRVLVFICHLLSNFRIGGTRLPAGPIRNILFAGSINEMASVRSTIETIDSQGQTVYSLGRPKFSTNKGGHYFFAPTWFSFTDIGKTFLLLVLRGPFLWLRLKRNHHPLARAHFFNVFCEVYVYLPYWLSILRDVRPDFVITSNDHNCPNRCLYAAARLLKIKTVYMQHASVSELFPALCFDYVFLDGMASFETYKKCEKNKPPRTTNVHEALIFLTGQKKILPAKNDAGNAQYVGVAINQLISIGDVVELVTHLIQSGHNVSLRWHPGQKPEDIKALQEKLPARPQLCFSDPYKESLSSFFLNCTTLISGNSSIHLEAAIFGIPTIYYEITKESIHDYYGYVSGGISKISKSLDDLLQILEVASDNLPNTNVEKIRYFSASFGTVWQGREGELVVETLNRTAAGLSVEDIYHRIPNSGNAEVYSLRS